MPIPITITSSNALQASEQAAVRALGAACEAAEAINLRINWDALAEAGDTSRHWLAYAGERLVGFATADNLGEMVAEITAMVVPDLRRQGIFSQMLARIRADSQAAGSDEIMLLFDRRSVAARALIQALGARQSHSEHMMRRPANLALTVPATALTIRYASEADAVHIATILLSKWERDADAAVRRVISGLRAGRRYCIALLGDTPVGTLNIEQILGQPYIYGFVVQPDFRGQGYGSQILGWALADLLNERQQDVLLEVEPDNTPAVRLYQSLGFVVETTFEYWALPASAGQSIRAERE